MATKKTGNDWRIYFHGTKDSGEGPFRTQKDAVEFARAEVGVPWTVRRKGTKASPSDPRGGPRRKAPSAAFVRAKMAKDGYESASMGRQGAGFLRD